MPGRRAAERGFSPRAWFKRAAAKVPTSAAGGILVGLFLAVTAAFGGLATAAPSAPTPVSLGTALTVNPWKLTVREVFTTDALTDSGSAGVEDGPYLVARVNVENTWDETLGTGGAPGDVASAVVAADVALKDGGRVEIYRADDARAAKDLQPGVPTELYLAWHLDPAQPVPTRATLRLLAAKLTTGTLAVSGEYFDTPALEASGTLTLSHRGGPVLVKDTSP